jgi:hypothetical protein
LGQVGKFYIWVSIQPDPKKMRWVRLGQLPDLT